MRLAKRLAAVVFVLSTSSALASGKYDCVGTEPFWGLSIRGSQMKYSDPEKTIAKIQVKSTQTAAGTGPEFLERFEAKTPAGYPVVATVNLNETCSDGMSDESYSHQIVLQISGSLLFGCCNVAK